VDNLLPLFALFTMEKLYTASPKPYTGVIHRFSTGTKNYK